MIYENTEHRKAAIENYKQVCANSTRMTVGELVRVLSRLPEDCRIFVDTGWETEDAIETAWYFEELNIVVLSIDHDESCILVETPEDVTLLRSIYKIQGVKIYDINDEG